MYFMYELMLFFTLFLKCISYTTFNKHRKQISSQNRPLAAELTVWIEEAFILVTASEQARTEDLTNAKLRVAELQQLFLAVF